MKNTTLFSSQRLTLEDFPAEFQLDLQDSRNIFSISCLVVGFMIAAVGVLFALFGPDKIAYAVGKDLSFMQRLQTYPGYVATIGFCIGAIGRFLLSYKADKNYRMAQQQIAEKLDFKKSDLPKGHALDLEEMGGNKFRVEMVERDDKDKVTGVY